MSDDQAHQTIEEHTRRHGEAHGQQTKKTWDSDAGRLDRQATYAKIKSLYGADFVNHFHHYSEKLFLQASAVLEPGNVAIDAGCYLAANALAMAEHVGDDGVVFTFEPDPRLNAKSAAIIAGNKRIQLQSVALSNIPGTALFQVVNEIEGHSGLAIRNNHGIEVTRQEVPVVVFTLDGFLASKNVDPARVKLIKYDLEGGELNALRGSVDTLAKGRPLVMFEFGNFQFYNATPTDYVEFFLSRGYRIIDAFGFDMRTEAEAAERIGWNYFAAPDEETAAFVLGLIKPQLAEFLKPR